MVCPCHKFENGIHSFDNSECVACGKCVKACNSEALYLFGKVIDTDELVPILLEDKVFYDNSNGGITLSGGECLMQASFCRDLLKKMKAHGIHTAVDTSGFVGREAIEKVLPYTDLFLYDIKAFSKEVHEKCTGHTNEIILENLKYIDEMGKKVEIRIPCVPEYNFGELNAIAEFLKTLKNPVKVRLLPYHNYAGTKYASLCMENTLPAIIPGESEMKKAREVFENWGIDVLN